MKKKWMANIYYTCSMVVAIGAVGCGGAIESCPGGWTALAWTCAAILMDGFAVALAALGVVSEAPENQKVHKKQENTVKAENFRGRRGA